MNERVICSAPSTVSGRQGLVRILSSRPAELEYALRSDDALTEKQIRQIMEYYLTARRVRTPDISSAAKPSGRGTPVPVVVQVLERRDAGSGRQPDRPRPGGG